MKLLTIFTLVLLMVFINSFPIFPQDCDSCGCATKPTYSSSNPSTFFGGKYKPNRSDHNNSASDNYFPILMVFVQFKNELGDSTTTNYDS
ncbi:MAG: hypothetical protein IPM96_14855 [Ignavibacteria bacterium]|nr:hypothetical protein [Ignavibacteria bacterium]